MPKFSPLCFNLPENPSIQVMRSLDSYNDVDFSKFRPVFFTVEHNFTNQQEKIDNLMQLNNYIRIFKEITAFDGWYVSGEALS